MVVALEGEVVVEKFVDELVGLKRVGDAEGIARMALGMDGRIGDGVAEIVWVILMSRVRGLDSGG